MDVESAKHLERFRDQPEIKAVLLRRQAVPAATEAHFERSPRNTLYWPPIQALAARFLSAGRPECIRESCTLYGRPCWLLASPLDPMLNGPYAIAVASAEGAPVDTLLALLQSVSHDFWHGSSFWK